MDMLLLMQNKLIQSLSRAVHCIYWYILGKSSDFLYDLGRKQKPYKSLKMLLELIINTIPEYMTVNTMRILRERLSSV